MGVGLKNWTRHWSPYYIPVNQTNSHLAHGCVCIYCQTWGRMAVSAPSRSSCPGPHPAERMRIPEMRKDQLGWLPAGKVGIHLPNPFHNCGPSSPSHCSPPQSPALPRKHKPIPLTLSLAFTLSHTRTEIKSAAPRGSQNAIPAEEGGEATDWALTPAIPGVRTPSQPALAAAGSPVFSQTCWSNFGLPR